MHSVINIHVPSIKYINTGTYMYLHRPRLSFAYFHLFVDSKRIRHSASEDEVYIIYEFSILADSFHFDLSFQSLFTGIMYKINAYNRQGYRYYDMTFTTIICWWLYLHTHCSGQCTEVQSSPSQSGQGDKTPARRARVPLPFSVIK